MIHLTIVKLSILTGQMDVKRETDGHTHTHTESEIKTRRLPPYPARAP